MGGLNLARMHSSAKEYNFFITEFMATLFAKYLRLFRILIKIREKPKTINFFLSLLFLIVFASYCYQFYVSPFEGVAQQLPMNVDLIGHPRTTLNSFLPV